MRRLKIAYAVLIAVSLLLFHILYLKGELSYVFINIFFLLAAPLGYGALGSKVFLRALFILPWIFLYPVFRIVYKVDPLNSGLPILVFDGLTLGFVKYRAMIENTKLEHDSKLKSQEDVRGKESSESKRLDAVETEIRRQELEVLNLYETTRKMSGSLKFDDIFEIFGAFLKENFTFRRCALIILRQDGPKTCVDRTYGIWPKRRSVHAAKINYEKLAELFLEDSFKTLFLTRRDDQKTLEKIGIGPEDRGFESFVGIPLLSEKKMVAVLVVENLSRTDLEKLTILSTQLALEIKKILLYEAVEELAITDSLTGLYVRRYFLERFSEELNRSKRLQLKFAFLMADIDDFKRCNDTYGHLVGDVVLKDVARIMKENTREIDLVGRYGGEEFSIILPEAEMAGALIVAERIREKIEDNIFKAYDEKLKATISIGVSLYPKDALEADDLIEKADKALYEAKRSGKNIVYMCR